MASNIAMPGKRFVIGVPYVWLFVFFLLPFLILLYISFVDQGESINPFKPIWDPATGILSLKYENYWTIFRDGEGGELFKTIYIEAYLRSIWYALWTAVLCLVIGYPFAYFIARSPASVRPALEHPAYVGHGVTGFEGQDVALALRPEKIEISKSRPDNASFNLFQGKVKEIGYLGSYTNYILKAGDGSKVRVTEANTTRQDLSDITWEDDVYFWWDDKAAVVLRD